MRAVVRPSLPADRRVLVISDIHGNLPFLKGLLKKVQFSTDDILLVLGGYFGEIHRRPGHPAVSHGPAPDPYPLLPPGQL